MMRMNLRIIGCLALAAFADAGTASADIVAINVTGPINPPAKDTAPFNYTQGSYVLGFVFRANSAISITQLGFYDSNLAGTSEKFASSAVGVYDLSTNTLLTSTTVTASDTANGFFRYAAITPLPLNTTDTYAVVGVSGTNFYTVGVPASTSPVNAAILYVSGAGYYSAAAGGSPGNDTQTNTLVEPNDFSAGNIFGNPTPPMDLADFGANFQFTIPAPAPAISATSGVVNGASFQAGIAAGSWLTINGQNLSTTTGTWGNSIVNGALPTTLDGVSVMVGSQPAYIEYVSPTQINAVAPNIPAGPVSVTVTNSNVTSQPATAQLTAEEPAFFQWGTYAVATRQDFSFAVKNGTFPGTTTVPAAPGDVIILWGTGFGPTSPSVQSGVETPSTTTYNTATAVTVKIGNMPATVYGAALAPGYAGLYQVAILIPASLANGDYPVVATISGTQSPSTTLITVQQ
jgi:uncharacterized protein (TIGR03437 family)